MRRHAFSRGRIAPAVIASVLALSAGEALPSEAQARSFGEARQIIAAHGFTHIHGLQLDSDDTWRGRAAKYDRRWEVQVDQRGNFSGAPIGAVGDWGSAQARRPKASIKLFLVIK